MVEAKDAHINAISLNQHGACSEERGLSGGWRAPPQRQDVTHRIITVWLQANWESTHCDLSFAPFSPSHSIWGISPQIKVLVPGSLHHNLARCPCRKGNCFTWANMSFKQWNSTNRSIKLNMKQSFSKLLSQYIFVSYNCKEKNVDLRRSTLWQNCDQALRLPLAFSTRLVYSHF